MLLIQEKETILTYSRLLYFVLKSSADPDLLEASQVPVGEAERHKVVRVDRFVKASHVV